MATTEGIKKAFEIMRANYPNFFKEKTRTQIEVLMSQWSNEFRRVDDIKLLRACELVVKDRDFFPNISVMSDKCHRVDLIDAMHKNTYLAAVDHYNEMKNAPQSQIELWVDIRRYCFEEPCTTADFKEQIEIAGRMVETAKARLTAEQRRELNIND